MTKDSFIPDWQCLAQSYLRGEFNSWHNHSRSQLLYAEKGVMLVRTGGKQWVIPPQRALWLPAGEGHAFTLLSDTELRTLYFTPRFVIETCGDKNLDHIHVIAMTSLARHLVSSVFTEVFNYPTQKLMAQLLLRIINETETLPVDLVMPSDERVLPIAQDILMNNRWNVSLSEFAALMMMSERTFSRFFNADTGYSFRVWKQRARILASMDLLANGMSIKHVAYKLGFSCPAAFVAAFRTVTGHTPGNFAGLSEQ